MCLLDYYLIVNWTIPSNSIQDELTVSVYPKDPLKNEVVAIEKYATKGNPKKWSVNITKTPHFVAMNYYVEIRAMVTASSLASTANSTFFVGKSAKSVEPKFNRSQ